MGITKIHPAVKYFAAIALKNREDIEPLIEELKSLLGVIELRSPFYSVDTFTRYYEREMGRQLQKCFIAFRGTGVVDRLPRYKQQTNKLEQQWAKQGKRTVNIDPGYITMAKVVLATTKDYAHRIYLDDGIFGDLHLVYSGGQYQPMPWTYPDYAQPLATDFFSTLRERLRSELKNG